MLGTTFGIRGFLLDPITWIAVVTVFLATSVLTRAFIRYARRGKILDVPNTRSSHITPTPRGGGFVIACAFLAALAIVGWRWGGGATETLVRTLVLGGLLIAIVGWMDDCRPMRARFRFLTQLAAAAWAVFALRGLHVLDLGFTEFSVNPVIGGLFAILAIVWISNLYNFMDGIDGLVASEAALVGGTAGTLLAIAGSPRLALIAWMLAAAAGGFLVWNWHPAKVFMGDVGSVLLGYSFGVLALATEWTRTLPALLWAILLMPFLVDATLTTLRRMLRGERWYEAHRTFSYQRAVQRGYRHSQVTGAVIAMEIPLIALAVLAFLRPVFLLPAFALALLGCTLVWWRFQPPRTVPSSSSF